MLFNYRNYSKNESISLVITAKRIAMYDNLYMMFGFIPAAGIITKILEPLSSSLHWIPGKMNVSIPPGWRELKPAELNLPDSAVDRFGYYKVTSPVTGKIIPSMGLQSRILGKFDHQNKIQNIALSWTGTNDLLDIPDYTQLNNGNITPHLEPLLNAVKSLAVKTIYLHKILLSPEIVWGADWLISMRKPERHWRADSLKTAITLHLPALIFMMTALF
ncbi:hypothetical protein UA45_08805 [Morganella morganii]|uniref:Uncharacterized protein n=1 Tax=Morganella morganii TaxID=582 RepID=A0A0D8L8D6_MORMO|nr:hypothetical protein UA45_08805 [Morganella morganii]